MDYYYRLLQWKARVTGLEYHSGENMNSATKHFIRSREHNIRRRIRSYFKMTFTHATCMKCSNEQLIAAPKE